MVRASAVGTRGGRATFVLGGSLFVAAGLIALQQTPLSPAFAWAAQTFTGEAGTVYAIALQEAGSALSALAVAVFAIGSTTGGSVVARRALGLTALLLLAAWPSVQRLVLAGVSAEAMAQWPSWLSNAFLLVGAVAGLVGVLEIARIGVVPGIWRWLPLVAWFALAGSVVFGRIAQDLGWNGGAADAPIVIVPYAIFLFATFLVPLVLGAVAIVLAVIAGRRARSAAEAASEPEPSG